ncbi:structural protein [Pseudomonas phage PSA-KC1]
MGGSSVVDQTGMTVLQAVDAIMCSRRARFVMCQNVNRTTWRDFVALEMKIMAYYNGSAATFADLKTAIENACVANGWALSDGILRRTVVFSNLLPLRRNLRCKAEPAKLAQR